MACPGQLQAAEAIGPLLDMLGPLDEEDDEWYFAEFPAVVGQMGKDVIGPVAAYLTDDAQSELSRESASAGLVKIATKFSETRSQVVKILSDELARHQPDLTELNSNLVADLVDLQAVESAELIERAFAENLIDPTHAGNWGEIKAKLGVPGLGLAPDDTPGWPTVWERFGFPQTSPDHKQIDTVAEEERLARVEKKRIAQQRHREQQVRQQAKSKRKQVRKSRKRNQKKRR